MSEQEYDMVNPSFEGDMPRRFRATNEMVAAQDAWSSFSKHIYENLPRFAFTLQRASDGKLFDFMAEEKIKKGSVTFKITQLDSPSSEADATFKEALRHAQENKKMLGGMRRKRYQHVDEAGDDDDDDDDDDFEDAEDAYDRLRYQRLTRRSVPAYYVWYTPSRYTTVVPNFNFYAPTFDGFTPYVEIQLLH